MARLLTIQEVAKEYGPSVHFWRSQMWKGAIKNVGSGNKYLLDRRDIEKLIQKRKG